MTLKNFVFVLATTILFNSCKKENIYSYYDYKKLGSSAHDLLSSILYSKLNVEVFYMPNYEPDNTSLERLRSFLEKYLNKPNGITISTIQIQSLGKPVLKLDEIVAIEKKNRISFTQAPEITVDILITDGDYSTANVLATSFWNTSICIFGRTLNDYSGGQYTVSRDTLLTTIMQHEFGHLLGLVNQGSPTLTNHADSNNGAHCNNESCLMYYNINSFGSNSTRNIPTFDINCILDLKANGGK